MNRFNIARDILAVAVERLFVTCEKMERDTLPHFRAIRFDSDGVNLKLSVHTRSRRTEILLSDVTPHSPFCLGLPGRSLNEVLQALSSGELIFDLNEILCKITTSTGRFDFSVLTPDHLPAVDSLSIKDWQEVNFDKFFAAIARISHCSATNELSGKSYNRSITVTNDLLVCTDSFRMSVYPNALVKCAEPILFPVESAKIIATIYKGMLGDGHIAIDGRRIHFSKEGVYSSSALYDGVFKGITNVIPRGPSIICEVQRGELLMALKRVSIISTNTAQFIFGEGKLQVKADREGHRVHESVAVNYADAPIKIQMNIKFVFQAVKSIGSNLIRIEIRGQELAVVISDKSGEHRNVVMPIRNA